MLINILSYVLTVYMVQGIPSTPMPATNNILIQSKEIINSTFLRQAMLTVLLTEEGIKPREEKKLGGIH